MSGKCRVNGLPDLARKSTLLFALKARQRKPSHFGSNCQPPSSGILSTDLASIDSVSRLIPNSATLGTEPIDVAP